MKPGKYIFLLFVLVAFSARGQETLLFHNVNSDSTEGDYGPNRKHYYTNIYQLGAHFGSTDSAGSDILPQRSMELVLGGRYKRQFNGFYAIGFQFDLEFSQYTIAQTDKKVFGGVGEHKLQKLMLGQGGISFYQRFNFMVHRGNHPGSFLDMGVYAEGQFYRRHVFIDKVDPVYGYEKHRTAFSHITWLNYLNYGAEARLGISFLYLFGKYRLSDMLRKKNDFPWPELPRFTAGIGFEFGAGNE